VRARELLSTLPIPSAILRPDGSVQEANAQWLGRMSRRSIADRCASRREQFEKVVAGELKDAAIACIDDSGAPAVLRVARTDDAILAFVSGDPPGILSSGGPESLADAGSWRYKSADGACWWSPGFLRLLEISPESERSVSKFLERVHPDDRSILEKALSDVTERSEPRRIVHRYLFDDGRFKWVEHIYDVHAGTDGLEAIGATRDISALVEIERSAKAKEHLLAIASRVGKLGGWQLDLSSSTVHWSDEVCRIHGVPSGFHPRVEDAISYYAPEHRDVIQRAV
jgi:PAS domain-containing protein